jgi:hypothetical protein
LIFLIWAFFLVSAAAQQPASLTEGIEGVVVNAETGAPVPFAELAVNISESAHTFAAGPEGRFSIGLPAGTHRLSVRKDGYAPARPATRRIPGREGLSFVIGPGERLRGIVVRLSPAAAISGTVVDARGEPIQRASVRAGPRFGFEDAAPALIDGETDDRGQFRLYGLGAGEYLIQVRVPRVSYVWGPALFYPGRTNISEAQSVTVKAGEERLLDVLVLPEIKDAPLQVRIVNDTGRNAAKAVWLLVDDMARIEQYSGNVAAYLPLRRVAESPPHRIGVAAETEDGALFGERVVDTPTREDEPVVITLGPGARLEGRAAPLPGLSVEFAGLFGGRPLLALGSLVRPVQRDGTFSIENLPEVEYQVHIRGLAPDAYVAGMRLNGAEVIGDRVRISGPSQLDIDIRTNGVTVEGRARNSRGAGVAALVVLVPEAPQRANPLLYRTADSSEDGRFLIRGAAPGRYRLLAWLEMPGNAYRNEVFMAQFESRGSAVTLVAGQTLRSDALLADEEPGQ